MAWGCFFLPILMVFGAGFVYLFLKLPPVGLLVMLGLLILITRPKP